MSYGAKGLNDYIEEINVANKDKGWRDDLASPRPNSPGDLLMLVVTELAEALEEVRDHHELDEVYFVLDKEGISKPEGVPIELADALIRIFDMAGRWGIDMEHAVRLKLDYNTTRPYKHGGRAL